MSAASSRPQGSDPVSRAEPGPGSAPRDWSWLALGFGLASVGWAIAMLLPSVEALPALPAWPAISAGLFALIAARAPGRALPRGLGAFLGVIGLLAGVAKILALWGLLELLGLTVSHM